MSNKPKPLLLNLKESEPRSLLSFLKNFPESNSIVCMKVNGIEQNLHTLIHPNCNVILEPIYLTDIEGEAVMRRSVIFLISLVFNRLIKERNWTVEHGLDYGVFCKFDDNQEVDEKFFEKVEKMIKEIVAEEKDIKENRVYYKDAIEYFQRMNMSYCYKLFTNYHCYDIKFSTCMNYQLFSLRPICHNTKMFKTIISMFGVKKKLHGWVIQFNFCKYAMYYTSQSEMKDKKIISLHNERTKFVKNFKVECVGDINNILVDGKIETFIMSNKTFLDFHLNVLSKRIRDRVTQSLKLILIAGPSSSGKTTFAKKLKYNLKCLGVETKVLSVDDYYRTRTQIPKDDKGNYDFECLEALRVEKLNDDLSKLIKGEEISVPKYNFITGIPEENHKTFKLPKKTVLVMEGIHCLNDKLTHLVDNSLKFKVFIAPFSSINLQDRSYISNDRVRLIRRIVRDKLYRGYSCLHTLNQWKSVRLGEHKYIFPTLQNADFVFNSSLEYEIGVLKPYIVPMLRQIESTSKYFDKAQAMLKFLKYFLPIPYKFVPRDSLLQEFISEK